MIYRLVVLSDEVDVFFREIEINSDSTFLDLQDAILDSVGFTKDQMTTFFLCSSNWEKRQEITIMEMETSSEYDSYLMEETPLDEFDLDEGDRMILTYDMLADRSFFIEVKEMKSGSVSAAKCTLAKGDAPQQLIAEEDFLLVDAKSSVAGGDAFGEFYGDSEFDMDELDVDGFGGMSSIDDLDERYL